MIKCPRCEQIVDETVRTTCPLCFTPLQPASSAAQETPTPQASYPPAQPAGPSVPASAGGQISMAAPQIGAPPAPSAGNPISPTAMGAAPGRRVSLTGEVYDEATPAAAGVSAAPGSYPGPMPARSHRPGSPAAARYRPGRAEEETGTRSSSGAFGLIVVLLLGAAGIGGWWYWNHRTNPKDQALALYKYAVAQDYKAMYPLVALSEETQKKYPDADSFVQKTQEELNANPGLRDMMQKSKDLVSDIKVGEPKIDGNKAEVPTSAKVNVLGMSINFNGTAHMINQSGVWKLDLTEASPQELQQKSMDLVGKPDMSTLPPGAQKLLRGGGQ